MPLALRLEDLRPPRYSCRHQNVAPAPDHSTLLPLAVTSRNIEGCYPGEARTAQEAGTLSCPIFVKQGLTQEQKSEHGQAVVGDVKVNCQIVYMLHAIIDHLAILL